MAGRCSNSEDRLVFGHAAWKSISVEAVTGAFREFGTVPEGSVRVLPPARGQNPPSSDRQEIAVLIDYH
jgi:hypothetical protein